jgi:HlyD family secretion protein
LAARDALVSSRAKLVRCRDKLAAIAYAAAAGPVAELVALQARGGPASASDVALARLKYSAAAARLATARLDQRNLTVRAPAAGTVTSVLTVAGAPVDGTTAVASVANLNRLAVRVDLSEFDVARVKPGLKARVSVDALGGEAFPGVVRYAALTGTDKDGVVTFPVIVSMKGVQGPRPGMNVSVRIIVARTRTSSGSDRRRLAGRRGQRDRRGDRLGRQGSTRKVKLGLANNKGVEVVSGLHAGERVAVEDELRRGGP